VYVPSIALIRHRVRIFHDDAIATVQVCGRYTLASSPKWGMIFHPFYGKKFLEFNFTCLRAKNVPYQNRFTMSSLFLKSPDWVIDRSVNWQ